MQKLLLSGAAAGALFASSLAVNAADLPAYRPAPAPAPYWSWSGFYLGGPVGSGWAHKEWTADPTGFFTFRVGPNGFPASSDIGGAVYGAQAGFNYQFGQTVLGLEVEGSFADIQGDTKCANAAFICETKVRALGAVTGRLGYAFDRALLYVKGGAAFASERYHADSFFFPVTGPFGVDLQARDTRWGGTVGAGLEYAFGPSWSAKVEYNYYGFDTRRIDFTNVATGAVVPLEIKQNIQIVKLGVNYKLDWFSPVVANY